MTDHGVPLILASRSRLRFACSLQEAGTRVLPAYEYSWRLSMRESAEQGAAQSAVQQSSKSVVSIHSPVLKSNRSLFLVSKPAPDFSSIAVIKGEFKEVSLSDFKSKYLVLLFYPLDL